MRSTNARLWDDTAVIVCTDHGHYLGERGIWGKPAVPLYGQMMHLPLIVWWPGLAPNRRGTTVDALTTSVDLHATIADVFGVAGDIEHRTHGRSLVPLIAGDRDHRARSGRWQACGDGRYRSSATVARCVTAARRQATTRRSRCGRTVGRPCRCMRSPKCACRGPTSAPRSTPCPARTCRSSGSRSTRATGFRSGRRGGSPATTSTTCRPIRPSNATWRDQADERDAVDLLVAALDDVEAPKEQRVRLGVG